MSTTTVSGGAVWWMLMRLRQVWCNVQVKLCDPYLSALSVLQQRCYINSLTFTLWCVSINKNNNNNNHNNFYGAVIMAEPLRELPGSLDECRMVPIGRRPKTKPDDLGCESACTGCQNLHPPSPFIIITQPESWYSFHRPTEGRRLSPPSWLVTYQDGLPVHRWSPIWILTGSDVVQLRWSRPMRYH